MVGEALVPMVTAGFLTTAFSDYNVTEGLLLLLLLGGFLWLCFQFFKGGF